MTLEALDIHKHWRGRPAPVLTGVDLAIEPGEAAWLTGSNGAGKTTLARILCGLIQPGSGSVRLGTLEPEHQRAAFQAQVGFLAAGDRGLYARLSVKRHLDMWAKIAFVPRDRRAAAIDRAVQRFALGELLRYRVDRLSTGQRQRVRLAMTFLHDPGLLLLDEPMSSLDVDGTGLLRDAIGEHVAGGGICMWISPGNDTPGIDFAHRWHLAGGQLT